MPRPPRCRLVRRTPLANRFGPYDRQPAGEVRLPLEGLEALRLVELKGFDQQAAAESMGVSRQTLGRILAAARQAVAQALVEGLVLVVEGGAYQIAPGPAPGQGRGRRRQRRRLRHP